MAVVALLALGALLLATSASAAGVRSARPVWAFLPTWDPNAMVSFRAHASQVTVALPTGLTLAPGPVPVNDVLPKGIEGLVHKRGVRLEPVLSNFGSQGWDPALADRTLRSAASEGRLVHALSGMAQLRGWDGLNVDLEALPARDRGPLVRFVGDLRRALGPARDVSVDVPADGARYADPHALAEAAGHVLVMAYDQHASPHGAGPIATTGFVRRAYRRAEALVPRSRLVLGLPAYAYEWVGGRPPGALGFYDALALARRSGVVPAWSPRAQALRFSFLRREVRHRVWMSDAASLAAELRSAVPPGQAVGLWRLGTEDPGIWPLLTWRTADGVALRSALQELPAPPTVSVHGFGDIVHATMGHGGRRVALPGGGERFVALPRPFSLLRSSGEGRRIALTFDDGPSGRWTPAILDELERLHVPATFFLIGQNAAAHPGVVQREVSSGFVVGNHTFTHPDLTTASPLRTRLEVMATERTIVGITGRRPLLFRAPYSADTTPSDPAALRGLIQAQHMGETVVGASVDSMDYLRPPARQIVRNVLRSLARRDGNIVLMHDGGGDRSRTVAALPMLVRALRARGYRLVSVPALLGVSPNAVMAPIHGWSLWLSRLFAWAIEGWFLAVGWIARIGAALIGLLLLRALVIVALAIRHRRRAAAPPAGPTPSVTVLVAAFDEEAVIERTVRCLQAQEGVSPEIIVIDDGSRDETAERAERLGVRVLRQRNAGKWAALNRGLAAARGEVVVAVDADTQIDRHAVVRMVRWFCDPRVGAVSGTAKVGNRHTLVTLWQHVEYVTSFNLDRRAYSDLNAITVVPGAIGAWRRRALVELGGYSGRTLAEDCDLTIGLRRAGWRIVYEPSAVAYTEAPETLRGLARQRLRWTFGTFQVLWLNRSALLRPREGALGLVALPYAWLYQLVLSLLAPAVDLLVVIALLTGGLSVVLWWFLIATGIEMAASWCAFRMEGERSWPVLAIPLQRFCYRQLMYWTVLRSLLRALSGERLGWGKLARTGTVQARTR